MAFHVSDFIQKGTHAGRPASSLLTIGQLYYETDTLTLFRDNGTTWDAVATNGGAGFATPAIVLGSSAAAGAASTVIRSDGTIAAFDTTVPVTQAYGDAAATGSAAFAARRDHKHGMPPEQLWMQPGSGKLVAAYGDGNPKIMANIGGTSISPTTLTQTTARAVLFRYAFTLAPAHLYIYGRATLAASCVLAIYPDPAGSSKLWDSGNIDLTLNTVTDITSAGTPALNSITLAANTDYWMCVTTTTTSGTNSIEVMSTNPIKNGTAPIAITGVGFPMQQIFTVTAGAFPGTLPALSVPTSTSSGGVLVYFSGVIS